MRTCWIHDDEQDCCEANCSLSEFNPALCHEAGSQNEKAEFDEDPPPSAAELTSRPIIDEPIPKEEVRAMGKKAMCKGCGKERSIVGRGLCGTCYNKARMAEKTPGPSASIAVMKEIAKQGAPPSGDALGDKILAAWNENIENLREIRSMVIGLKKYGIDVSLPEVVV